MKQKKHMRTGALGLAAALLCTGLFGCGAAKDTAAEHGTSQSTAEDTGRSGDILSKNDSQRIVLASKKEIFSGMESYTENTYRYDAEGRVVSEYQNQYAGAVLRYTYDDADRMIQKDEYDQYGTMTVRSTKYSYDENGNLTLIDTEGFYPQTYSYVYDNQGRIMECWSDWAETNSVFSYDENGNCVQITQEGYSPQETRYFYAEDVQNALPEQNEYGEFKLPADREECVSENKNIVIERTYDENCRVLTEKNTSVYFEGQDGNETSRLIEEYDYTYNADGILQKVLYSNNWRNVENILEPVSETLYEYAPLSTLLAESYYKAENVETMQPFDLGEGVLEPEFFIAEDTRPEYQVELENDAILRLSPQETAQPVQTIPGGSKIFEIAFSNDIKDWIVTEWNGKYGWVSADEIELIMGDYAKPVIYLYPETETDVQVQLELPNGEITCAWPSYSGGWNVIAQPDGTLINKADGEEYSYLYWEGAGGMLYDFSQGFVVKGKDTAEFLRRALKTMGLTPKEYNEFIVYWYPLMQNNTYNLISFQFENYEQAAQLKITPQPDSVLRVFMAYKPLSRPVAVQPQQLPAWQRSGFSAVEWGGTCVKE